MNKIQMAVADSFIFLGSELNSLSDKVARYGINLHIRFRTSKGLKIAKKMKSAELAMIRATRDNKEQAMKEYERREKNRLKDMIKNPSPNQSKGES